MIDLIDSTAQIFFLLRFLCFTAIVYLALHRFVRRFSVKRDSKLLWFFTVLTAPLTRPIKLRMAPGATDDRILSVALIFYGILWLVLVMVERFIRALPR